MASLAGFVISGSHNTSPKISIKNSFHIVKLNKNKLIKKSIYMCRKYVSLSRRLFSFLYWISSFPQYRTHTVTHNSRRNRTVLYFIECAVGVLVGFAVWFFCVAVYAAVFIFFFLFFIGI